METLSVDWRRFEKYAPRQDIARFLARYELFKMQLHVKGSVVECGVHHGSGLLAWAKLSAALEPYAINRRIYGFDTFEGFPSVHNNDRPVAQNDRMREGGFSTGYDVYEELQQLIREYDDNRFLNQFEKVYLVKGDAVETIPSFIKENPHILVSMLFLDFDLYEPTRVALEHFLPRMPAGSILAFDEVNNPSWPGETTALLSQMDLNKLELKRFPFDPNIAYAVL